MSVALHVTRSAELGLPRQSRPLRRFRTKIAGEKCNVLGAIIVRSIEICMLNYTDKRKTGFIHVQPLDLWQASVQLQHQADIAEIIDAA